MIKIFEKFNEPEIKIGYWDNGQKYTEEWLLNGKRHREDGPAFQEWYENGQKKSEYWFLNGKKHKEDGYAYQWWYENGQKGAEFSYLNGESHREDGYARQTWFQNGSIWYYSYFLNDKSYYSRKEWVEKLGEIGSKHYEEQQMLLDMEKYNL